MKRSKLLKLLIVLLASFSLMTLPAMANDDPKNVAVAVQAGTLGVGVQGILGINDYLEGRIGANALYFDLDEVEIKGLDYDFDVNGWNYNALLDWRPWANNFHFTGGVIYNDNEIEVQSSDVSSFSGDVEYNKWAPYLGIGFSKPLAKQNSNWSLMLDLGAAYIGEPDVSSSTSGPVSSEAEQNIKDKTDNFQFYPVAMAGISYRF